MNLKNIQLKIKSSISIFLKKLGYSISSVDLSMEGCFKRCINRGVKINGVIDVGAAVGNWSKMALKYLPQAQYLLIEAQLAHQPALEALKKKHANIHFITAAAGNRLGKVYFDNKNLLGGQVLEKPVPSDCIEVPVTTIDAAIKKSGLPPPYLIKLDTHGYEVPILEGASEALKHTNLLIIEAYNYQITKDSLRFFELCQYMSTLGFSPIELADCMLRPHDNSLWQMDIFFIPSNSKTFEHSGYK